MSWHCNMQHQSEPGAFDGTSVLHSLYPVHSVPPRGLRLGDGLAKILLTLLFVVNGGCNCSSPARGPGRILCKTPPALVPAALMRNVAVVASTEGRTTTPPRHGARPRLSGRRLTRPARHVTCPCRGRSGRLTGRRAQLTRPALPARRRGRGRGRGGREPRRGGRCGGARPASLKTVSSDGRCLL